MHVTQITVSSIVVAASALHVFGQAAGVGNSLNASDPASAGYQLSTTESPKGVLACCQTLSSLLPGKVFNADNGTSYKNLLASYWSQQEQQVLPACLVVPENAADVSSVISVLNQAGNSICPFAVKSGGHTPFAGSANVQNGVTIDLAKLNSIVLSSDKTQVCVGPGNTWADVSTKLDALNLTVVGGRASSVGVGGLTLGGGFSFFSPQHGLVCDNVINFEVVLPSGSIVNANASSLPDLFKVLKGGSGNFGIVTRLDMRVFPQGNFWGGFIVQNISSAPQQFEAFEAFASSKNYDTAATMIQNFAFTAATGWLIASDYEYTNATEKLPAVFDNFTSIQPQLVNTMRISNLTDFTNEIDGKNVHGLRQSFSTATYKNSAIMQAKYFEIANATILSPKYDLASAPDITLSLSFQPEPQSVLAPLATANSTIQGTGNILGLTPADGDLVNVLLTISWASAADDLRIESAAQTILAQAETFAKQNGFYQSYLYLNYAAEWQDPLDGYGKESLTLMNKVAGEVDPNGLFQKQVKGGFRLTDAGHSNNSTVPAVVPASNATNVPTAAGARKMSRQLGL